MSNEHSRKTSELEFQLRKVEGEKEDLSRRLNDYDNRIAQLSQEIERLNGVLRAKVNENETLKSEFKSFEMRISS